MISYKFVMTEHLNHYGFLYGGNLLKWVDETAWIAVSLDYPNAHFVTVGMDKVEFKKQVVLGAILRFDINRVKEGHTSASYCVDVTMREPTKTLDIPIFHTDITFVRVDANGKKMLLSAPAS